ncbi:hypothetical protein [Salinirubrum litoreum]|uniref:Uncharacterized protein n=1 Tax=Salinirubrum litoreum TaxID=1126234 RepID=A0ABD5RDP0_9EURY|nr:hypothetical protein [Salinirubrum litoreum]
MLARLDPRDRPGTALLVGVVCLLLVAGLAVPAAEGRARTAEERHLETRLADADCLDDWGVREGTERYAASVSGVTARGVVVSVEVPYAYTVDRDGTTVYADTASEATYVVGPGGTERQGGDDVRPCDP